MKKLILLAVFCLAACSSQKQFSEYSPEDVQSKMQAAAAVTEHHAVLKQMVGNWKVKSSFWTDPSKAPEVTTGSAKFSLVLGGRFLRQDYTGTFWGQKFTGFGYTGYNNMTGKYTTNWADSMMTHFMHSEGSFNPSTNTFEYYGSNVCPVTNEKVKSREVLQLVDKNHLLFTMYMTIPGQAEIKGMELSYLRR